MPVLRKTKTNSSPGTPKRPSSPDLMSAMSSNNTVGSASSSGSKTSQRSASASKTTNAFHPRLILSQIMALQSWHYFTLCTIFQINYYIFGYSVTLDRIFTTNYLNIWTAPGWVDNTAVILSSLLGACFLAVFVEKAKKCLDFSVTLFLLHLMICTVYDGFPASWDWWIIHVFGLILMVLVGEYLCSRVELREIPLLA